MIPGRPRDRTARPVRRGTGRYVPSVVGEYGGASRPPRGNMAVRPVRRGIGRYVPSAAWIWRYIPPAAEYGGTSRPPRGNMAVRPVRCVDMAVRPVRRGMAVRFVGAALCGRPDVRERNGQDRSLHVKNAGTACKHTRVLRGGRAGGGAKGAERSRPFPTLNTKHARNGMQTHARNGMQTHAKRYANTRASSGARRMAGGWYPPIFKRSLKPLSHFPCPLAGKPGAGGVS